MAPPKDNNGDSPGVPTSPEIDVNTLLRILANPTRRSIIEYLASTTETTVTLEEIAEYIADGSPDREEVDPELTEIECHHNHLPKLSDAGVLQYDPLMGDVRYNRHRAVEQLLDAVAEIENYL